MTDDTQDLILIAKSLGFRRLGVVDLDAKDTLSDAMVPFRAWIARGFAGEMDYLARHAELRESPVGLLNGPVTHLRAIVVAMDYLADVGEVVESSPVAGWQQKHFNALADPSRAVISVYAHGRDYHKVLRRRLTQLSEQLRLQTGATYQFRACVDSAPVLEVELASRAGLGWRGKHTLLLNREQGSMFFLGVLLTDMPIAPRLFEPLPETSPQGHCGSCTKCLDICPTKAFVGPYQLDARRCISYLTIEHPGVIDPALRPLIGNRIYGCDDCQAVCPWNRYAQQATVADFDVRHGLDSAGLITLFSWTETEFQERHQGSAILRIGYERWLRNIAIAMGNSLRATQSDAPLRSALIASLANRLDHPSAIVREHVQWALGEGA
jgi:epoxyqueuosine reductase